MFVTDKTLFNPKIQDLIVRIYGYTEFNILFTMFSKSSLCIYTMWKEVEDEDMIEEEKMGKIRR